MIQKYGPVRYKQKKAFKDNGFNVAEYNDSLGPSPGSMSIWRNVRAEIFFAKVDITKEPIIQTIDVMHRQRALEYYKDKDGREIKSINYKKVKPAGLTELIRNPNF